MTIPSPYLNNITDSLTSIYIYLQSSYNNRQEMNELSCKRLMTIGVQYIDLFMFIDNRFISVQL